MEYNLKSNASRKIVLSGKLNAKTTPPRVFRVFIAPRYHRMYRQLRSNGKGGFFVNAEHLLS